MFDFDIISYILLPVLIFLARVADVTVATVKLMFVVNNARRMAAILGFIEAFITIVALSRIIQDASNMFSFVMYAAGFATGTYAGMWIEEKMAYGNVLVRIIGKSIPDPLLAYLNDNSYRYSKVDANDQSGNTQVLFTVCKRSKLDVLLSNLEKHAPETLYTIEGIKQASHELLPEPQKRSSFRLENIIAAWGKRTRATFLHW